MNNTRFKIRKYRELKADIVDIDIKIKELEDDMLGISAASQEERTGQTYKISRSVENQAEKHMEKKEELIKIKNKKIRQIEKIDNAMSVLDEVEKEIIDTVLINNYRYSKMQEKLHLSYPRIKQIESDALKKMEKYV